MPKKRRKKGRKRGKYVSTKMKVEMTYRSGWELRFFMYLDSLPEVVAFYSEPFKIPYVANKTTGRTRNYIPDLLIEYADKKVLLEIKPKNKLTKRINIKKFHVAREWCMVNAATFEIVTEVELKALGLL